MSAAIAPYYSPVLRDRGLERLAIRVEAPVDWAEVHKDVQESLVRLENEVREKVDGVQVRVSRTHGASFLLFSYRTFSVPNADIDPVVVGLKFTPSGDQVAMEADVSGEQSGDTIVASSIRKVPNSQKAATDGARELSETLCQAGAAIVKALRDPNRKVE